MFQKGQIWVYPTDTSFGLGVRIDDQETLQRMYDLKQRPMGKYFSLMVRDEAMLREFAVVPDGRNWEEWFTERPRTAILQPTEKVPKSEFWPEDKVAFRICTIPEIAQYIEYPVTATSANLSGMGNEYSIEKLKTIFGEAAEYSEVVDELPVVPSSEIWDLTVVDPVQLR